MCVRACVCTRVYEVLSNHSDTGHVYDQPRRTRVVDSRQLIPFSFSVQTGQFASLLTMMSLTHYGWIEPRTCVNKDVRAQPVFEKPKT